jgi:exodeoxyribonuclease V beta subunit
MSSADTAAQGATTYNEFDLLGPLPTGTTVLEASAGTGKTYTIAALVTRYVAEGIARIDEMLVVTFGRMATQELRDRVRARLVSARDALEDPSAALESDDPLVRHLAAHDAPARRQRLAQALGSFDTATVATTHEFCSRVLTGLGTAADIDSDVTFVENVDDLTVEVVQDLYLRMWSRPNADVPPMDVAAAIALAHEAVRDHQAVLLPHDAAPNSAPDLRFRFARAVREEVDRRKRERYLLTFDDLLTRLQATLAADGSGATAATRLRERYRVVLVDEFQDTDPVQWDILRIAFHGHTTLVLIGDPKQAIYAFRGADVHAYLAAEQIADHRRTLGTNWRSDPDLVTGLEALFRGAALGDDRIVVRPVAAGHAGRSLSTPGAPVEIRVVRGEATTIDPARDAVVSDVVRTVVDLLDPAIELTPRFDGTSTPESRPLRPGDIAIVVDTNRQVDLLHDALLAAGIPSVQRKTSSVFKTAAGNDWVVLLDALAQPQRSNVLRRLAISSFVGWSAADLDTGDLDALGLQVRRWLRVFNERGIAALFETVSRDQQLPRRMLSELDGERRLTDLRHVSEALHAAATADQLGLAALLVWLRRRVHESASDSTVERSRRLDSDAAAVQLVTVWASKGLEFPVVLVPFEWDRYPKAEQVPLFHDEHGARVRWVGGDGDGYDEAAQRARTELQGEHLRLLYVAVTRAQARVVAWWAPTKKNTETAPLHRLLFTDDPATGVPERAAVFPETRAAVVLRGRAVPDRLDITAFHASPAGHWQGPAEQPATLAAASLDRGVDTDWRRTSYSALTSSVYDATASVTSEPDVAEKDDEPDTPAPLGTGNDALREVPSAMDTLPGGAAFGTLVHSVLEAADTTAADLAGEMAGHVAAELRRSGTRGIGVDELVDALLPSLRTPLGPLADNCALTDLARADRLVELDFELPLRGGDSPNGVTALREIADLLRTHLPADDPMRAYAQLLEDRVVADGLLRGYLTGSIDAVLRIGEPGAQRFVIVDYKTNRLGEADLPITAWDYRPDALVEAMLHAHYPLQALLYAVALHRFLRWRLPNYDPQQHLGGVLYLFLRGMVGPDVTGDDGSIPGVFQWRPPAALVTALSDLLANGTQR